MAALLFAIAMPRLTRRVPPPATLHYQTPETPCVASAVSLPYQPRCAVMTKAVLLVGPGSSPVASVRLFVRNKKCREEKKNKLKLII